ncbi:hypothetical protein H5410_051684 [Solanum commersonii]|uniref:Uncharacterized protein n=1 Tax=Solanum commersonii TaxID=4109 RepID=A0A9J5WYT2_SOLCO|nr:hypothetical protein H5410_051684 [Solanum commersonii]
MSTHSFGHQSSDFGFAISPSGKSKTHGWLFFTDCVAEDRSAILVEIADEFSNPPFNQLIAFSFLPSVSLYFESLGGTVLLCETNRLRVLEQRAVHVNSATRQVGLDDPPTFISFFFSPFCSILRLSVHASSKTSNT